MSPQPMCDEPLVSVIVPVYNADHFVGQCIESILGQTHEHVEVILIDDGSTDASLEICEQWASRDSRVQVVHKRNEGAGIARNVGLGLAQGEYVCFVDADDYLDANAVKRSLDLASECSADIVIFGFSFVDERGILLGDHVPSPPKLVYKGPEVMRDVLPNLIAPDYVAHEDWHIRMTLWGKLYRHDVLKRAAWHMYSERDVLSEDVCSLLELFPSIGTVVFVAEPLYSYREHAASLSRNYLSGNIDSIDRFYERCITIADEKGLGDVIKDRLKYPYLSYLVASLKQLCMSHYSVGDRRREVLRICDSEVFRCLSKDGLGYIGPSRGILMFCLRHRMAAAALFLAYGQVRFR